MAQNIISVIFLVLVTSPVHLKNDFDVLKIVEYDDGIPMYIDDNEFIRRPEEDSPATSSASKTFYLSPILLNTEWPKNLRIIFLAFPITALGSTLSGIFIATFCVNKTLNKKGNVYLALTGLSDLIVVGPIAFSVVWKLLSDDSDTLSLCHFLHFLAALSTYSYSLFFSLTGLEHYLRLCCSPEQYDCFIFRHGCLVSVGVFLVSAVAAALDVYMELDYDYCERKHYGHFGYRFSMTAIFHIVPFVLTMTELIAAIRSIERRAREQKSYKRSLQYSRDYRLTFASIVAFATYALFWTPHLVVTFLVPDAADGTYYYTAWTGLFRAFLNNFVFAICNGDFATTYRHLISYCICKTEIKDPGHRQRGDVELGLVGRGREGISTHILHQVLNNVSPQRAAATSRETQNL